MARRVAWSNVGIYFTLMVAGLTLQGLAHTSYVGIPLSILSIVSLLVGIWPVTGALIVSRFPRNPVGWLLCFGFTAGSIDMFAMGYAAYSTSEFSGPLPGVDLAFVWLTFGGLPFAVAAFTLMLLLFPDGVPLSPGWGKVGWIAVGVLILYLPLQAVEPGPADEYFLPFISNPLGASTSLWKLLEPLMWSALIILMLCFAAASLSLLSRLRRSQGDERQQIKCLVYPAALYLMCLPILVIGPGLIGSNRLFLGIAIGAGLLALGSMPIATSFAIFKYRLYEVDLVINRTLVYGALTLIIVTFYVLTVGGLGLLFQAQGNILIALFATGIVAVLFHPLREWLQRGVNRLFYGERDDPLAALSHLGKRLEATLAPEVVLPTLVETIAQTLRLPYAAISLQTGDEGTIAAHSGEEVASAIRLPLIYQGTIVGELIAGQRGIEEPFSQSDKQLLESIAYQAGPAVRAVQLTAALQRSRQQLVTAIEEERRRLRRDLHDGLGPALASQGLKMAAAGQLLGADPDRALRLLEELAVQNETMVAEIRRIVYELRPAALDDLGLVGAIRDYAIGLGDGAGTSPRLEVAVQAPAAGLPPLPAAIEVAAYRITTEALTNVVRHAEARHATASLEFVSNNGSPGLLHLEIADDGVGMSRAVKAGIGLISMRERAEEIGGRFVVESRLGGGTRLVAELPCGEADWA